MLLLCKWEEDYSCRQMWSSMDMAFLSKQKYSFALLEAQHITQEKKLGYFVRVILDNILPKGVHCPASAGRPLNSN